MTVRQVLLAAYAKTKKAQPGNIATEPTELKGVVYRALVGLFAAAARVNPLYYGTSTSVAYSSPGWALPDDHELLFGLETPAGVEVVEVPFNDRTLEAGARPAVYFMGRIFRGAGNVGDPSSGSLTFYYARLPEEPVDVNAEIDSGFPGQFSELLIHETAIYLVLKEGDDTQNPLLAQLKTERDRWARLYIAHLEHVSAIGVSNAPPVRQFSGHATVPIGSLLAGGSEV